MATKQEVIDSFNSFATGVARNISALKLRDYAATMLDYADTIKPTASKGLHMVGNDIRLGVDPNTLSFDGVMTNSTKIMSTNQTGKIQELIFNTNRGIDVVSRNEQGFESSLYMMLTSSEGNPDTPKASFYVRGEQYFTEYSIELNRINVISFNPTFQGITYNDDISAQFTANSLVTKAYVDNKFGVAKYIVRETPSGVLNGTNKAFTLANLPVVGKEMVFLNGQLLTAVSDYTISGVNITITIAPSASDKIRVTYYRQ